MSMKRQKTPETGEATEWTRVTPHFLTIPKGLTKWKGHARLARTSRVKARKPKNWEGPRRAPTPLPPLIPLSPWYRIKDRLLLHGDMVTFIEALLSPVKCDLHTFLILISG